MHLISAKAYENAEVDAKIVRKTGETWVSMEDIGSDMGAKNISDLVLEEISGILATKNPSKEQISKYKIIERKLYETFDNLSEEELNTKSNKTVYIKNDVMTNIIKHSRGKKKKRNKSNRWIQKKINDSRL